MEKLIPTFMRVLRNIDDQSTLQATLQATLQQETKAKPTQKLTLSDTERRQILDLPDAETEQKIIAAMSSSSKKDILLRGATSPDQLTDSELYLLKDRYWLDIKWPEAMACIGPENEDEDSDEGAKIREATTRLEQARALLYEEHEKEALENAGNELIRREREDFERRMREDAELRLARAHHPDRADTEERKEEYEGKKVTVLFSTKAQPSLPQVLSFDWTLERLEWPEGDLNLDQGLEERLDVLRRNFREKRALPPNRKHCRNLDGEKTDGLLDGIQQNVFLYIDRDCVDSTLDRPRVMDDMWVWAVDPDYTPAGEKDGYKGYLRVRLQQLMHRFFEARHFHADEYQMESLWRASLKAPRMQAFLSFRHDEVDAWDGNIYAGSALSTYRRVVDSEGRVVEDRRLI